MKHTAGRFTYDTETGTLTGPKAYLDSEQYALTMRGIQAGTNVVMQMAPADSPIEMRMLVALQMAQLEEVK